jgi:hypothetical protein
MSIFKCITISHQGVHFPPPLSRSVTKNFLVSIQVSNLNQFTTDNRMYLSDGNGGWGLKF